MTKLSVNLNAIALLRNRRDLPWPDLLHFARLALDAGAIGITVHPRPDERHVRFKDLTNIRKLLDDDYKDREFNIEGYPTDHFLSLVEENGADQVTLVPDAPQQSTSDHGWDFEANADRLAPIIARLKKNKIRVSLFADPEPKGLDIAAKIGADRVEFFTGPYGATFNDEKQQKIELQRLQQASETAKQYGLAINAGHDLTVANIPPLIKAVPYIAEASIGHALIADALEYGMNITVKRFIDAMSQ
ncbi:pyridoxine 5'-phosphate synthase [Bartonella sp. HY329]|uniref:pyridoxine 5'-phosphate synthase n=1 Tax=unclassified Bartonella TaxID=2645622 RepID=UPI0021C7AC9F|nr:MULTISPECIES: pyridoxine 5'-phosphate synthase [unclassified Bartonella]UXM95694.1 pyridoxine 5'-phosphate synthase [Bartonella sp. HY329]UXN10019.1 pyridoxine 5'-phosphate synthase [Bartonella sp. HY328]